MRNTYKYTQLYSGGTPEFIEGNVFKTIVPLDTVSVGKVSPTTNILVTDQDSDQDKAVDVAQQILAFCNVERGKQEICSHLGYRNLTFFTRKYLTPLLQSGQLLMTLPDKPRSKNKSISQQKKNSSIESKRQIQPNYKKRTNSAIIKAEKEAGVSIQYATNQKAKYF